MKVEVVNIDRIVKEFKLKEVVSYVITNPDQTFHVGGLFSNVIFGEMGTPEWENTFAYIDLHNYILHPFVYDMCKRHFKLIIDVMYNEKVLVLNGSKVVGIEPHDRASGISGFYALKNNWRSVLDYLLKDRPQHAELINKLKRFDYNAFPSKWLVIPPKYRSVSIDPLTKRISYHPINNLYASIIKESQKSELLGKSDYVSVRLTELVYQLFSSIVDLLKGKEGLFRQKLLGRRVDFSSRSVITVDASLRTNQIGVPKKHALKLFLPFVIYHLKNNTDLLQEVLTAEGIESIPELLDLLQAFSEDKKSISKKSLDILYNKILPIAVQGKVVLAKRDPTLQRHSIRAFYVKLVDDMTIHIPPAIVGGFNADFDGDQMSLYLPLTEDAQKQAKEKMLVDKEIVSPVDGSIDVKLSAEYVLGLYYLTQDFKPIGNPKEFDLEVSLDDILSYWKDKKYEVASAVKFNKKVTTVGKLIVIVLVKDLIGELLVDLPPINKSLLNTLAKRVLEKGGSDKYLDFIDTLKDIVAVVMTVYGKSFSLDDFILPPDLEKQRKALENIDDPNEFSKKSDEIFSKFLEYAKSKQLWTIDMIESGSKAKASQYKQIVIAKGLVMDPTGKVSKAISGRLGDGLKPTEYFTSSYGARKGMIDRSQRTADTGYLTRKMVYAESEVLLDTSKKDCGTIHTLDFKVNEKLAKAIDKRYIVDEKGNLLLVGKDVSVESLIGKTVKLRSPLYCKAKNGICPTCYGTLYEIHKTKSIGMIAAHAIGERNTQLTMQTFHTGGSVSTMYNEDYLSEIETLLPVIRDYIYQIKDKLYAKKSLVIAVPYNEENLEENKITTNSFYINFGESYTYVEGNSLLVFDVDGYQVERINDNVEAFILNLKVNDFIAKVEASAMDITEAATYVVKLLERYQGKELSMEQLLFKLFDIYSNFVILPLVHFEILISIMSRDPHNINRPYRLSGMTEEPLILGLKQLPKALGWLKAAMFENFKMALETGFINPSYNKNDPLIKLIDM